MALLPSSQRDQIKLMVGFAAVALLAAYVLYPYASRATLLDEDEARTAHLVELNHAALQDVQKLTLQEMRIVAAKDRANLNFKRRLIPQSSEVPALLEEVSTAARQAGLDIGGVTPEPVIPGDAFDTYRYTIVIIGTYHQFGTFLANVGSLARIVAAVNFSIVADNSGRSPLVKLPEKKVLAASITLQTYVERTAQGQQTPAPTKRSAP